MRYGSNAHVATTWAPGCRHLRSSIAHASAKGSTHRHLASTSWGVCKDVAVRQCYARGDFETPLLKSVQSFVTLAVRKTFRKHVKVLWLQGVSEMRTVTSNEHSLGGEYMHRNPAASR
jgi:hypothetical protein